MPGNMGMNAWLGKSNCHSSFPLFLPSLLHYRQMTGQSCCRSRRCFSSIRHHSITSCSLTSSSNKSLCLLMSLFIASRLVCFRFGFAPHSLPPASCRCLTPTSLSLPLFFLFFASQCLPLSSPLEVMDSVLCFLFPFPLSSSLFPQVSNTLHNQSVAPPPSLHPSLNPTVPSVVPLSPDFFQSPPSLTSLYLCLPFLLF